MVNLSTFPVDKEHVGWSQQESSGQQLCGQMETSDDVPEGWILGLVLFSIIFSDLDSGFKYTNSRFADYNNW